MPLKPIERLLFAQGRLCFFCQQELAPAEASVEHLVAVAKGGSNGDENTVACCKALNSLLGCKSLKEKLRVVLNQKGAFTCPNGHAKPKSPVGLPDEVVQRVSARLQKPGARPKTKERLTNTIQHLSHGKLDAQQVAALIDQLQLLKIVVIDGTKVSYPPAANA